MFDLVDKYEVLVQHKRALGDDARAYFYREAPYHLLIGGSLDDIEPNAVPVPTVREAKRVINLSDTGNPYPYQENPNNYGRHLGFLMKYRIRGTDSRHAAAVTRHISRHMRTGSMFVHTNGTLYVPEHGISILNSRSVRMDYNERQTINNLHLTSRDREMWKTDILREGEYYREEGAPPIKYETLTFSSGSFGYNIYCEGPFCTVGDFDMSFTMVKDDFDGNYKIRLAMIINCMDSTVVYMGNIALRMNKSQMCSSTEVLHMNMTDLVGESLEEILTTM